MSTCHDLLGVLLKIPSIYDANPSANHQEHLQTKIKTHTEVQPQYAIA